MPEKIPLMIWSDAVSAPSGLARITRDIASRVHEHMADVFDVSTIGYGGSSSSKFPWHQYAWAYSDDDRTGPRSVSVDGASGNLLG